MSRDRQRRRRGRTLLRIVLAMVVCGVGVAIWMITRTPAEPMYPAGAFYKVERGDLLISVVEDGTLRAVNETIIRSGLDGEARILSLAPEGSYVEKGDLLVELDSSLLRDRLNQQEIEYQDAAFILEQARQNLKIQQSLAESQIKDSELRVELSQADLEKYRNGDAPLQIRTAEARMKVLREQVRIAQERADRTAVLFKAGNATKSEVEADSLTLKREQLGLTQYEEDLRLIKKFDQPNTLRQMEATAVKEGLELGRLKQRTSNELAQAQADLKTSQKALDLMEENLKKQRGRLGNAKILAPQPGLVIYAAVNPWQLANLGGDEGRSRGREAGIAGFRDGSGILRGSGGGGGGERRGRSRGGGAGGSGSGTGGSSGAASSAAASVSAGQATATAGSQAGSPGGAGTASGGGGRGSGGGGLASSASGDAGRSSSPSFSSFSSLRQGSTRPTGSGGSGASSSGQSAEASSFSSSGSSGGGNQGSSFGSSSGGFRSSSSGSSSWVDWSATPGVIAEGALVRQRQELIRLPDVSQMLVEVQIPESRVRQVQQGFDAVIRIENRPDRRFRGSVRKVALLPDAQASWLNPNAKLYATEVLIDDEVSRLRPGVSARAEIIITNILQALSVPIQSVVSRPGGPVCFAKRGQSVVPVPVTTGLFNDQFVEITAGLKSGDLVLLAPPLGESDEAEKPPETGSTNTIPSSAGNRDSRPKAAGPSPREGRPEPGDRKSELSPPRNRVAPDQIRSTPDGAALEEPAPPERGNRRARRSREPRPQSTEDGVPSPAPDPKP